GGGKDHITAHGAHGGGILRISGGNGQYSHVVPEHIGHHHGRTHVVRHHGCVARLEGTDYLGIGIGGRAGRGHLMLSVQVDVPLVHFHSLGRVDHDVACFINDTRAARDHEGQPLVLTACTAAQTEAVAV